MFFRVYITAEERGVLVLTRRINHSILTSCDSAIIAEDWFPLSDVVFIASLFCRLFIGRQMPLSKYKASDIGLSCN